MSLERYRAACDAYEAAELRVARAADARALALLDMARAGWSLRQIADAVGVTRARVCQLLARAREVQAGAEVADERAAGPVLTADMLTEASARVVVLRAEIRRQAATARVDSLALLGDCGALRVAGWNHATGESWDWLYGLHRAEVARLRRWLASDALAPSEVAAELRHRVPALSRLCDDDIMVDVWLYHTRIVDAGGAVARGRRPSARCYSGRVDLDALAPGVAAEGYDIAVLLGDDHAASRHVAMVDAARVQDSAYNLLAGCQSPQFGPAAWRMSVDSYESELLSIDAQLAGDDVLELDETTLRARRAELVPKLLDDGADWRTLHATIVATAREAGLLPV